MTVTVEGQVNYMIQWFGEWSELQRTDFVSIIAEKLARGEDGKPVYVNGIVNCMASISCDKPMSLFECRVKLFREWYDHWSQEQKDRFVKRISEMDESFAQRLNAELSGTPIENGAMDEFEQVIRDARVANPVENGQEAHEPVVAAAPAILEIDELQVI